MKGDGSEPMAVRRHPLRPPRSRPARSEGGTFHDQLASRVQTSPRRDRSLVEP